MARIRLNLKNLTATEKIAKGRQIVTAMTNNNSFPTPTPTLADVTAALEDLEKAFCTGPVSEIGGRNTSRRTR